MDPRIAAELAAHTGDDEAFVDGAFTTLLRRPPDSEARARALGRLADGTLSRATLLFELATAEEHRRVRELDDAVSLGLAARSRGERLRWLAGPPLADERVVEIPWVLSRLTSASVLEVGYAFAEPAYVAALVRAAPARLVGADLASRDVERMETVVADARELPFADGELDQVLLVSTLEHIGADNAVYGHDDAGPAVPSARLDALREIRRVLAGTGELLVTVPLGEPGEHGWFRQDDVRGWTRLFVRAGFFVEEQEAYVLEDEGWRADPAFRPAGVRYGERGAGASAVLCTALSPVRLRRLLTPSGVGRSARRRLRPALHGRRRPAAS